MGSSVSLNSPQGLAFDNSGDLWVANVAGNPEQLFGAVQWCGGLVWCCESRSDNDDCTETGLPLSSLAFSPPPYGFAYSYAVAGEDEHNADEGIH